MTKTIFDSSNFVGEDSYFAYEDDRDFFFEFLNELITNYEKRYRTEVIGLRLGGTVGRWNGNPIGGKIIAVDSNPIEQMGSVETVEVVVEDDGVITILGHHHDGTHRMNIYLLTENKLKQVSPSYLNHNQVDYEDMERMVEHLKPLKCSQKVVESYYGPKAA